MTYVLIYDRNEHLLARSGDVEGIPGVKEMPLKARIPDQHFIRKVKGKGIEISAPINHNGLHLGLLRVGITEKYRSLLLAEVFRNVTLSSVLLLVLGVGMSFILSKKILDPVSELAGFARKIGEGVWGKTIKARSQDEIGKLTEAFNEMSLKLSESIKKTEKAQEQLVRAEKFSALGKVSETLAHDLKNPVSSIRFLVEDAIDSHEKNYFSEEDMKMILYEMERIDGMVNEMLSISGHQKLFRSRGNINDLVEQIVSKMRYKLEAEMIKFELELGKEVPEFDFDGGKIEHAIYNILINAMQAMNGGGTISLITQYVHDESSVLIIIKDTGGGIPPEIQKMIFDPYFTTKESGTGLGLSMVYGIVSEHEGTIEVTSKVSEGTTFTLTFPV